MSYKLDHLLQILITMSNKPEDTNSSPVAAGNGEDTIAAKSNAENDTAASPADAGTEGQSKSKPFSFPFRFKGRNDIVMGGHNPPDPNQTKTGGSSVTNPQPQGPKLK